MQPVIKLFSNPYLERLTNTHFAAVLIIYSVILVAALYGSVNLSVSKFTFLFSVGLLMWTGVEYVVHRFIFHSTLFQSRCQQFYLIIHGIHHQTPRDKKRLLVPLYVSLPIAGLFYGAFYLLLGVKANAFFSGLICGYLFYDYTHYHLHNFQPRTRWGKYLRANHFAHHFKNHHRNFGVTSPLWDRIIGTRL
jgi:sterol desaturase/sphingolipid hydroxylase (fatty acid hydroxylase superfamily)